MHVAEEYDLVLPVVSRHELLGEVDCWVEQARRIWPSSVQVTADHVAAIVADYNSVRVQHGNYFEDEGVSQELSLSIVLLQQELNRTMNHKRGV